MLLNRNTVDQFVKHSDELGGPGTTACSDYWAGLEYQPTVNLDLQVAPLSLAYQEQQLQLYEEIVGKPYGGASDEFTPNVPVDRLIDAPNAYDHPSPSEFAKHCVAIGLLVQKLGLSRDSKVLELGSGWGMCQEFLANCGFQTIGIDANPDFVAACNGRLERLGYGKRALCHEFDDVAVEKLGKFEGVIAYEAFHHALDPYDLLMRSVQCLEEGGVFALGAEPFNNYYVSWGLRRDPYSIYCIRKFGWFESGWSASYMAYLFGKCGMSAEFTDLPISELTRYMVGRHSTWRAPFQLGLWHPDIRDSVFIEEGGLHLKSHSKIMVPAPSSCAYVELDIVNHAPRSLAVSFSIGGAVSSGIIAPGTHRQKLGPLAICEARELRMIDIESETFCPASEGMSEDSRSLGVYLKGMDVY